MDELTLIAELLGGPETEPSADVVERGRTALLRAAAEVGANGPVRVLRPERRPRRGLLWTAVGAAAAAAVAVAVVVPGSGPSTRAPSASGVPGVTGPARSTLDGHGLLLAAADTVVAHGSGATGAYWTARTVSEQTWTVEGGYRVVARTLLQTWVSRDGDRTWLGRQELGAAPASAADRQKWERAGSPLSFTVPASSEAGAMRIGAGPGALTVSRIPSGLPGLFNFGGCTYTPAQTLALPGDERGLSARLSACAALGEQVPMPSGSRTLHPPLWGGLTDMLTSWPISPATQAAAYRLLAAQSEVRDLGPATDPLGRAGRQLLVTDGGGRALVRFVLDPATGLILSAGKGPAVGMNAEAASLGGSWTDQAPASAPAG